MQYGWNIAPLVAPLDSVYVQRTFLCQEQRKLYLGFCLEFAADSLPDNWGNVVFQKWMEANHLQSKMVNAVDRLSFIGKRAVDLGFQPAHIQEDASVNIELASFSRLANRAVISEWQN